MSVLCLDCSNAKSNNGDCTEVVSSNGHTTHLTPIREGDDVYVLTNEDTSNIFQPTSNCGCNGYTPRKND